MIVLLALGCGSYEERLVSASSIAPEADAELGEGFAGAPPPPAKSAPPRGRAKKQVAEFARLEAADEAPMEEMEAQKEDFDGDFGAAKDNNVAPGSAAGGEAAPMRQWFPESFVWRPSLRTDEQGLANIDLTVPDQLTTWRLLALAHDDRGFQTGAEHRFASELPVSVEPLVPDWLYVGDDLVVHGRAQALGKAASGNVRISTSGAVDGAGGGAVQMGPGGSRLVQAQVRAVRSGRGLVRAEIFGPERLDGAERPITVRPRGRRIVTQRGGLLPRTLTLQNDEATEQRISVRVFPGPLAVFQAELDRIENRPPAGTSYAVLDGITRLSQAAGIQVDTERHRTVRLKAWQRLVKQARSPSAPEAGRLLHGMKAPSDPLAEALHSRLVRTTIEGQRGDGTWSSAQRSTAQRILVETATYARALPETEEGARLRAGGALERLLPNVDDGFTAAWVLASGVVDEGFRNDLQDKVLAGIEERDGVHVLKSASAVDAAGRHPTRAQQLAVAVIALHDRDDLPWKGELVSELLQQWSAARGFGSGWADAVAFDALALAMPPLDQPVEVSLNQDGATVASGTVDPSQPSVPVVLELPKGGQVSLAAEPAVPGLSFVLTHSAWVPFTGEESLPGVDVHVQAGPMSAGLESAILVTLAAPSGTSVEVEQGVPAGTTIEAPGGRVAEHEIQADHIWLRTEPFGAGEVITVTIPVIPQYQGQLHTPPLVLRAGGNEVQLKPLVWNVRGGGS